MTRLGWKPRDATHSWEETPGGPAPLLRPDALRQEADARAPLVDFDAVYHELIAPAVEAAGTRGHPRRRGNDRRDHPQADVRAAHPVRVRRRRPDDGQRQRLLRAGRPPRRAALEHGAPVRAGGRQLPFDVAPLRAIPYSLDADGQAGGCRRGKATLTERLKDAQRAATDSPIFQLVEDFPEIDHTKTDVFRDRVEYSARGEGAPRQRARQGLDGRPRDRGRAGRVAKDEAAVVIDLFLSYRAVKAWPDMIALVGRMSPALAQTVMVREQLALALNRPGAGPKPSRVLAGADREARARAARPTASWAASTRTAGRQRRRPARRSARPRPAGARRSTPTCGASRPTGGTRIRASTPSPDGAARAAGPPAQGAHAGRPLRRGAADRGRPAGLLGSRHPPRAGRARAGRRGCRDASRMRSPRCANPGSRRPPRATCA